MKKNGEKYEGRRVQDGVSRYKKKGRDGIRKYHREARKIRGRAKKRGEKRGGHL